MYHTHNLACKMIHTCLPRTEQGQFAVILMDPEGRKFRTKEEVRKYVEMKRVVGLDPESMDFSVFGKV